ncbi:MAG: hypothetical protein LPK09_14765 [Hymenobacteraceae bacterium]|nr:hypothetical protein [Hymenobacteraceae bacterium]
MDCFKTGACILLISFCLSFPLQAQHHTDAPVHNSGSSETAGALRASHSRLSLLMYHNYVKVRTAVGSHIVVTPSLGLDFEYWFSNHWGLGLHNDLIFTHKAQQDLLSERTYPFLTSIDGLCKVYKGLVVVFGPGIEFEETHHLFFLRGGIEYEIHLGSHWDVCPTIFYDNRRNAYNTCSVGLGIGKSF